MAQVTVMTGPERRHRWTADERGEILMAAFAPGAVVADVSRRYEVATSLIYKWRREVLESQAEARFIPAVMMEGAPCSEAESRPASAIVVELASGVRVTINASSPATLVEATLRALR
jgi:transposase